MTSSIEKTVQIESEARVPFSFYLSESWTKEDLINWITNNLIARLWGQTPAEATTFGIRIPLQLLESYYRTNDPDETLEFSLLLKNVYFIDRAQSFFQKYGQYNPGVAVTITLVNSSLVPIFAGFQWEFGDLQPYKARGECLAFLSKCAANGCTVNNTVFDPYNPTFMLYCGVGNMLQIKFSNCPSFPGVPVYPANFVFYSQTSVPFPIFSNFTEFFMFFVSKMQSQGNNIAYIPSGPQSMGILEVINENNQNPSIIFSETNQYINKNEYRFGFNNPTNGKPLSENSFSSFFVNLINAIVINLGKFKRRTINSDYTLYLRLREENDLFDHPIFCDYIPQFDGEIVAQRVILNSNA